MKESLGKMRLCVFAVTVILLGLMLISAPYDVPSMDDFSFSVRAKQALDAGKGLPGAVAAAAETAAYDYVNWQGTFSSIFFMALMPGIFRLRAYAVTPVIMLSLLFLGIMYFFRSLSEDEEDLIRMDITGLMAFISVTQCMPDPTEGIYWYNGAVHYTLPVSAALLFCGSMVRISRGTGRRAPAVIMMITAVLTGGGNYVTGIVLALLIVSYLVFVSMKVFRERAFMFFPVASYLILSAAFAPLWYGSGNIEAGRARDAIFCFYIVALTVNLILFSQRERRAAELRGILEPGAARLRLMIPGMALFFICFILNVAAPGNKVRSATMESFGAFHSIGLSLYSGFTVPLREWTDWLPALALILTVLIFSGVRLKKLAIVVPLFVIFLVMSFKGGPGRYTALSSLKSVSNGDAAVYLDQVRDRTSYIAHLTGDEVVKAYSIRPEPVFEGDITGDETQWVNQAYARYYGLQSVRTEGEY